MSSQPEDTIQTCSKYSCATTNSIVM